MPIVIGIMALITRSLGRKGRSTGLALGLLLLAAGAQATCLPLPSPDLRALEHRVEADPERAVGAIEQRLRSEHPAEPALTEAQLYAIVASARADAGRSAEARAAALAGLAQLGRLPPAPDVERVRARLLIAQYIDAETKADLDAAVRAIDALLEHHPVPSAERSCALAARAELRGEQLQLDTAAADGIAAYRMAESGGWEETRVAVAGSLAGVYRRSGLLADAERLIGEVIAYQQAQNLTGQVAMSVYLRGQVLADQHRYEEARAALGWARQASQRIGDAFGAAVVAVPLCPVLIAMRELAAADRECRGSVAAFEAAGRRDLVTLMLGFQAELELVRGHPAAALARLDEVLGPRAADIVALSEARLYRDRARALAALGRPVAAFGDLRRAEALQEALDLAQRSHTVSVLKAAADTEKLLAANRALEERMASQRAELSERTLVQRLAVALAVLAVLASVLLAYLLRATRRHARTIRRQEAVVRAASSNAPDALLLLDVERRVRFANRSLFGDGAAPAVGSAVAAGVPPEARAALNAALDEAAQYLHAVSFALQSPGPAAGARHYELRTAPVVDDGQLTGFTLRSFDVTELRRLEREVIEVASRERQRLSSDLHEGLGQELTGVSLLARSLDRAVARGQPNAGELVAEIIGHINRAIEVTREIARGLSPVRIERGSLSVALARLAGEARRRLRIEVDARSLPEDIEMSDVAADHLYRIAYEAVTNAARHSGCRRVHIRLERDSQELRLSVSDDGGGLSADAVDGDGLGLKMMAYRARLLGASFRIDPVDGGGTRISVAAPAAATT
ncbi:MAG: PAS domain-containing protein [Proteobacteria bacterium]|nr:PAS domain-containing protein [Pseudomonadota bacterium]